MAFRPSGASTVVSVDASDVSRVAQLLAMTNEDFENSLAGLNMRLIGLFAEKAEERFLSSIKRPKESGMRAVGPSDARWGRMTGRFTPFGALSGKAFKGVLIRDKAKHRYGFGYPNVQHADAYTAGVWQVLEYGLTGTKVRADERPDGRDPIHLVPRSWPGDVFMPRTRAGWQGSGLEPKRFIRDTARTFIVGGYYRYVTDLYDRKMREFLS